MSILNAKKKGNPLLWNFSHFYIGIKYSTVTLHYILNTIFLPTLTHQCQTWALTKVLERKLVTCEMKCLWRAANKTKRDKLRIDVIRDTVGATPVLHHIEQQQIKWFGHLMRMSPDQPAL